MSDIILNIVISFVVSILVVRLGVRFSSWTGIRRFQNLIPNLKTIVVCYIPISVLFSVVGSFDMHLIKRWKEVVSRPRLSL